MSNIGKSGIPDFKSGSIKTGTDSAEKNTLNLRIPATPLRVY